MMGQREIDEYLQTIAEGLRSGRPDVNAQTAILALMSEALTALSSIATSLEELAACVHRPHPAAPDQTAVFQSAHPF